MDRAALDWTEPATGGTALHVICALASDPSKSEDQRRYARLSIDYLLSFIGFVNPSHPCFHAVPITDQWIAPRLDIARAIAKEYAFVHLPKQIWRGMVALYCEEMKKAPVWKPLIALVVEYVF